MVMLALIIGSLALVAATVSIVLTVMERKRNRKQNAAYVENLRTLTSEHRKAMEDYIHQQLSENEKRTGDAFSQWEKRANATYIQFKDDYGKRLHDLENGVVPDFEKAKAAADAVNQFSVGISGILGFDPMQALQQSRNKDGEG